MNRPLTGCADLHMHTIYSDGLASPRHMLDHAARQGRYDVIAITDHDILDGSLWAYEQNGRYPFEIVPGVEVTSAEGHVLALWVTQPIPKKLSLAETAAAIHEQGGLAILAHPFEPTIAPQTLLRHFRNPSVLITLGIDAVEVHNAGCITPGHNQVARCVFRHVDLAQVGGSDAHMPQNIGSGVTRFAGRTAADLRSAIVTRQTCAEGQAWPVSAYLKLSITSIQRRRRRSLAMKLHWSHPTPPSN